VETRACTKILETVPNPDTFVGEPPHTAAQPPHAVEEPNSNLHFIFPYSSMYFYISIYIFIIVCLLLLFLLLLLLLIYFYFLFGLLCVKFCNYSTHHTGHTRCIPSPFQLQSILTPVREPLSSARDHLPPFIIIIIIIIIIKQTQTGNTSANSNHHHISQSTIPTPLQFHNSKPWLFHISLNQTNHHHRNHLPKMPLHRASASPIHHPKDPILLPARKEEIKKKTARAQAPP
jgi:hypothetical protein